MVGRRRGAQPREELDKRGEHGRADTSAPGRMNEVENGVAQLKALPTEEAVTPKRPPRLDGDAAKQADGNTEKAESFQCQAIPRGCGLSTLGNACTSVAMGATLRVSLRGSK